MKYSITRSQVNLLAFITNEIKRDGIAPSYDEMKDHLGLKSKSAVTL